MNDFTEIDLFARELQEKYGTVQYVTRGMYAPKDYSGIKAPYVTPHQFQQFIELARVKLAYLYETADPRNTAAPESFVDLRDGGSDLRGSQDRPVMTGWLTYAGETIANIPFLTGLERAGNKIAEDFSCFVVIGIGGSYTNIEGIINAVFPFGPRIRFYYLGQHLSAECYEKFFKEIQSYKKKAAVNIISKSGATTEPAIAARIVIEKLSKMNKLGAVFATTDPEKGALRETIEKRNFNPPSYLADEVLKDFYIGENIGGRFSSITPGGLLPFAVAGIRLKDFLAGYHYAVRFLRDTITEVTALKYAAYGNGAVNAVLSYNAASFRMKILGYRQLWPECNGKNGQGLNVMEEFYTSDAHSNGQLIKSGPRNMMEIFHFIDVIQADMNIPQSGFNNDKLGIVAEGTPGNPSLHKINNLFMGALLLDHYKSGVPVIAVRIPALNPFLVAMQMGVEHVSAVLFGLMAGINPVNQPGVQGYKEIAFKLLGMQGDDMKKQEERELEDFGICF